MNQTIIYNNYKFDLKLEQSSVSIKFFDTVSLELFEGLINENEIYINPIAKFYKMLINALNKEKDFTIEIDKTSTKIKCTLLYKTEFIELEEIFPLNPADNTKAAKFHMQDKITKLEATNTKLEKQIELLMDQINKLTERVDVIVTENQTTSKVINVFIDNFVVEKTTCRHYNIIRIPENVFKILSFCDYETRKYIVDNIFNKIKGEPSIRDNNVYNDFYYYSIIYPLLLHSCDRIFEYVLGLVEIPTERHTPVLRSLITQIIRFDIDPNYDKIKIINKFRILKKYFPNYVTICNNDNYILTDLKNYCYDAKVVKQEIIDYLRELGFAI